MKQHANKQNTLEQVLDHNLEVAHKFTVLELALFEISMFTFGLLIGQVFPQLLSISPIIYGAIALSGTLYVISSFITKNTNFSKRVQRKGMHIHLAKKFGVLDFSIYKITILTAALFLMQIWQALHAIPIVVLISIFAFGLGYFTKTFFHKYK